MSMKLYGFKEETGRVGYVYQVNHQSGTVYKWSSHVWPDHEEGYEDTPEAALEAIAEHWSRVIVYDSDAVSVKPRMAVHPSMAIAAMERGVPLTMREV